MNSVTITALAVISILIRECIRVADGMTIFLICSIPKTLTLSGLLGISFRTTETLHPKCLFGNCKFSSYLLVSDQFRIVHSNIYKRYFKSIPEHHRKLFPNLANVQVSELSNKNEFLVKVYSCLNSLNYIQYDPEPRSCPRFVSIDFKVFITIHSLML